MEKKTKIASLLYEAVVFLLMLAGILYYRPSVFSYIPLLVSVVVMLLQAKVNRYAFLLGAANSILYAVAYVKMSLFATALYALLVSCPLQVATFLNWKCHTAKNKTALKHMANRRRLLLLFCMLGGFAILYAIFLAFDSQYLLLDNAITVLGIAASVLCLLRFSEYAFLQIATNGIMLVTFLLMLKTDPSRIIWAINSANAVISSCLALKNMKKERKETDHGREDHM